MVSLPPQETSRADTSGEAAERVTDVPSLPADAPPVPAVSPSSRKALPK